MLPTPVTSDQIIPDSLAVPKHAWLKASLARLGRALGPAAYHIQAGVNYLLLGAWLREHGFTGGIAVEDRRALYSYVASLLTEPILYLEFGVFMGASIQAWSRLIPHPEARFVGFDSFLGMPEDFDVRTGVLRGELNRHGRTPAITDPRVSFVAGWFNDTLPGFVVPAHTRLVIHIDCDLYSATMEVFGALRSEIRPGTVILFDDMGAPQHEPRAFAEFMRSSGLRFRLVAYDREDHYAFECVAV